MSDHAISTLLEETRRRVYRILAGDE